MPDGHAVRTNEDEAVGLANATDYGLVAAVWTQSLARAMRLVHAIEAGQVYVNGFGTGGSVEVPFGGMKKQRHRARKKGIRGGFPETTPRRKTRANTPLRLIRVEIKNTTGTCQMAPIMPSVCSPEISSRWDSLQGRRWAHRSNSPHLFGPAGGDRGRGIPARQPAAERAEPDRSLWCFQVTAKRALDELASAGYATRGNGGKGTRVNSKVRGTNGQRAPCRA